MFVGVAVTNNTARPNFVAIFKFAPRAVISNIATAISTVLDQLPAIHYQMVDLGGPVPVAPYQTFGSKELADVTSKALQGRSAVIMKNHGALTTADSLEKAFNRCVTLEWCSKVQLRAMSAGSPSILSEDQMHLAKEQFESFEAKRAAFKPT